MNVSFFLSECHACLDWKAMCDGMSHIWKGSGSFVCEMSSNGPMCGPCSDAPVNGGSRVANMFIGSAKGAHMSVCTLYVETVALMVRIYRYVHCT